MTDKRTVLVVGARQNSLGASVAKVASEAGYEIVTAGLNANQPGGEDVALDLMVDHYDNMVGLLKEYAPMHIVCTAGMNMLKPEGNGDLREWYRWHMETNFIGPMRLLDAWRVAMQDSDYLPEVKEPLHYVAISSNSARIPRTNSAAYCASKAALSMGLRVAAREGEGGSYGYLVYGYEPGLLYGTPMTDQITNALPGVPLTRMQGFASAGLYVGDLARVIVSNLQARTVAFNGCLIPFDTGEQ